MYHAVRDSSATSTLKHVLFRLYAQQYVVMSCHPFLKQEQKYIIIHPHAVYYGAHTVHVRTPKITVTDIFSEGPA